MIAALAREYAGALRLAFEWSFRSLEIIITIQRDNQKFWGKANHLVKLFAALFDKTYMWLYWDKKSN